ncbi:putative PurR-regulated permease PerM [Mucilaginibacter yixingensis]|uniref:Putative PurR-regulated permease PerM n=1 Tax=Mucilaginibacter yixingensis TaxID=1295612 RepID=A0A2T5J6Q7_9SPHI|nr:AI-2E family transporter [Mucilaginibacter yixingensis]PTQ94136.1 putative PurR-regulated permease PerM [Mucilaginibacter yixingensis]
MAQKKLIAPFYERLSLVLIGIIALGFLIVEGKEFLAPMMFGFLFAILLLPVCKFFERKCKLPRSAASFLSIALLVSFIFCIAYLVASQIGGLAGDWPKLRVQIDESVKALQNWVQTTFHIQTQEQINYLHNTTNKIMASGTAVVGSAVGSLFLFYTFIIIFTFFILFYRRLLLSFLLGVFTGNNDDLVFDIVENIQSIIRQYIIGLLLEMLIVSIVASIVFLCIGVKYALLLGIITGLFNIIPYIGIFSAAALSTLITFATGAVVKAGIVLCSVICIHLLDSNLLLPLVVGSKVRLNALITFLGIVIGELLWGLSGMFLSIPTIAIMKIIFDRIESLRPWGFLLGGAYEYKEPAEKEMKTE